MMSLGCRIWFKKASNGSAVWAKAGPTPPRPLIPWHPMQPLEMKSRLPSILSSLAREEAVSKIANRRRESRTISFIIAPFSEYFSYHIKIFYNFKDDIWWKVSG
ncbi:MAG: hypothetical protein RIG61_04205 [Deltaproteobacteria bacterium]